MIQVLIVDDHMMTRRGIKFFLEEDTEIKVVAEACDGNEGIVLCDSLNPDVVLMDINMPKLSGIEAVKTIISNQPSIKIIVLTGSANRSEIQHSLSAGAKGYCLKDINYTNLIEAIKTVVSGDIWIDSSISESLLKGLTPAGDPGNKSNVTSYELSNRELEVLALVVEGKTNQAIASELGLGIDTIKSHLKGIMDKLRVIDRTQAAVKAVREGLV